MKQIQAIWGKNFAVAYEKSEEKNGGGVIGTANRYARRAGMPVTTQVWTKHYLPRMHPMKF